MNIKGSCNTKNRYKYVIDSLIEDYSSNQHQYQVMFNENDHDTTPSLNQQFLEGIYKKYSKNLDKYIKDNQKGIKLIGSKKYESVPVSLFLKESKSYKEAIILELHNKYRDKGATITLDQIVLTPLPDKPRILLNTQQEKEEFQTAERLAVVMRTVEYTNALKNQENQYALMKKEEREQMIYIIKRASNVIQNWWDSYGKEGMLKRRKLRREEKERIKKVTFTMNNLYESLGNNLYDRKKEFFDVMKRRYFIKRNIITHYYLGYHNNELKSKINNNKWDFYTKKVYCLLNIENNNQTTNQNLDYFNKKRNNKNTSQFLNQIEAVKYLQNSLICYLHKKKISKIKKLFLRLRIKYNDKQRIKMLYKCFIRWIRGMYYTTGIHYFYSKIKQLSNKCKPLWYTNLSNVLSKLLKKRLIPIFSYLRYTQQKKIAMNKLTNIINDHNLKIGIKNIKGMTKINILKRIIIRRNKLNFLWKYTQLWNIKNLLIHIFVQKIYKSTFIKKRKIIIKKIKRLFFTNKKYNK